jgi:signal transduction histidine kinase
MKNGTPPEGHSAPLPSGDAHSGKSDDSGGWIGKVDALVTFDARTWLLIPLHFLVFLVLYFGGLNLLERSFFQAASASSKILLRDIVGETPMLAPIRSGPEGEQHLFAHLVAAHDEVDLRLFDLQGEPLVDLPPNDLLSLSEVGDFAHSGESDRFWLGPDPNTMQMVGLTQVVGDARCEPCHQSGQALALASMSFDYTETFAAVHYKLKLHLVILLVIWMVAVGLTNRMVHTSVGRSSRRLQKDLDAAFRGERHEASAADLVLDPKLAQMHESLRRFLERQRARDSQVSDRLEQTDRLASLGQLAAGLAHEIKNPLAGIQGALEIMREDLPEGSPDSSLCDRMLDEMDRVNQTLQLLLTSARPSPPRLAATDVAELLDKIRQLLVHGLQKQGIELEVVIAPDLDAAWIDGAKIRQVLVNLIGNAREAIEGKGQIVVTAGAFPQGDGLIVTVKDDGPGISKEMRAQIFEPFFTTKFSGTGLGLAIARRLVEQHQGRLQVESSVGEGTTFFVLIPDTRGETKDSVDTIMGGRDDGSDSSG